MTALEPQAGSPPPSGSSLRLTERAEAVVTNDRYSRRVALLKRVLPAIGLTLLLLISLWPRLHPLLESVRLGLPVIDLREARELRMVKPRYAGLDRFDRPYVVTAAYGRQVPDRNDVMALERPKAVMTVHGGASVVVTAATGIYQSQAQLLDLFEDVNLVHEDGTRFVTRRAHLNLSDNIAEGQNPVEGHGPSGDIMGDGFRILSKGDTIIFTGQSSLLLKGTKASTTPAVPPTVPPEIVDAAAKLEATAAAPAADPVRPPAMAKPRETKPGAKLHGAAKRPPAAQHAGKLVPSSRSAVIKVNHANHFAKGAEPR
jgi:lipopolysaccharide export system protein LptC